MMKKPKLLICDIDGTIVEKGEDPGPITLAVIKRLHDDGVMLGLASGRPVEERTIRKFIQWGLDCECDVVIRFNGNQMWNRFDRRIEEIEKRYGFIHVDYDNYGNGTGKRSLKDSYHWYQKVCASNGEDLGG